MVRMLHPHEYKTAKTLLNQCTHPTFIGRSTFERSAQNGGAFLFVLDDRPVAVALVNPHLSCLNVLSVHPSVRSLGVARAVVSFVAANFARVISEFVPMFERFGYTSVGALKQGRTLGTQIMVRADLIPLAGRIAQAFAPRLLAVLLRGDSLAMRTDSAARKRSRR